MLNGTEGEEGGFGGNSENLAERDLLLLVRHLRPEVDLTAVFVRQHLAERQRARVRGLPRVSKQYVSRDQVGCRVSSFPHQDRQASRFPPEGHAVAQGDLELHEVCPQADPRLPRDCPDNFKQVGHLSGLPGRGESYENGPDIRYASLTVAYVFEQNEKNVWHSYSDIPEVRSHSSELADPIRPEVGSNEVSCPGQQTP